MIEFKCPFCHQSQEYPDSRLGQLEECPACHNVCQVSRPRTSTYTAAKRRPVRSLADQRASMSRTIMLCLLGGGLVCVALGAILAWPPAAAESATPAILIAVGVLAVAIWLAGVPGAIAREKRLPNAEGISIMGILGMFLPIIWLVALILALAAAPPNPAARVGDSSRPAESRRSCPRCGESIPVAAAMCRFCGIQL